MAIAEDDGDAGTEGLREGVVPTVRVFGQAVTLIGASLSASAIAPLIVGAAGGAAWLTMLIGTAAVACIGVCIAAIARAHPSAGALYDIIPHGLGKDAALIAGVTTILVMIALGPFDTFGLGLTAGGLIQDLGLGRVSSAGMGGIGLGMLFLLTVLALMDIRLSTKVFFTVELVSMTLIFILLIVALVHHGGAIDSQQFRLHGATTHGTVLGIVFVVLTFGGFEGSAALGIEARHPRRAVPLALIGSVVLVGLFDAFTIYVQTLTFRGTGFNLATQGAPFTTLSQIAGVRWLGDLVTAGVFVSFFAATSAWLTYTGRVALRMARDGILPVQLGRTSRYASPHIAIIALASIGGAATVGLVVASASLQATFGDVGTAVGYGLTLMYLLVSVAAPVWLWREGRLTPGIAVAGVIGAALMILEFRYSFVPVPPYPVNILMYGFWAFVVLSVVFVIARRLGLTGSIGQPRISERPLEAAEVPAQASAPEVAGISAQTEGTRPEAPGSDRV